MKKKKEKKEQVTISKEDFDRADRVLEVPLMDFAGFIEWVMSEGIRHDD